MMADFETDIERCLDVLEQGGTILYPTDTIWGIGCDATNAAAVEKVFTIKEVIKLADQLACALSHCHKVGVKHGDIKSNNVKFNNNTGNYVLLDFGLSVMSDEQRRSSMRHAGAIEFMAPEQNEGQMLFQTDIYSYGVILYELLAGQVPFPLKDNGETARTNVMLAHMETPVPDLLQLRRENLPADWPEREMHIPGWLLMMIATCLEKKPEDRYADGEALHEYISESSIAEMRVEVVKEIEAAHVVPPAPIMVERAYIPEQPGVMRMSKSVFAGLMILLTGFMAYSAYSLFQPKPKIQPQVQTIMPDTARIADSFRNAERQRIIDARNKRHKTDSLTQGAIGNALDRANNPDSTKTDTTGNQ